MFGKRVLLADPDQDYRKRLKDLLTQHGYLVAAETEDSQSTLQAAFQTEPDIIIMEAKLPGSKGLEIARVIEEHHLAPVVLITSQNDRDIIEEAKFSAVLGYLLKPVDETSLIPTLEMAMGIFKRLTRLSKENKSLKKELEERKLIEKAKCLLIEKKGFSEATAHRHLQKLSMDRCCSLAKIAQLVINSLSKG
ncbi:ANTAR domain-containing response regulator [Desulforamulus ferrireducens]|uniref:Stage 0 sporulation protein A homolog n=1 Tax=Desulforamulus ferrireducens TaxID=1833852 RepID=A0A1S6IZB3_9FIRM|nr:ANTAR domain-containing protein [Desulforamulus ferrireducens]AQS60108.1 response regulator [Desulforamulus ferrireducens]